MNAFSLDCLQGARLGFAGEVNEAEASLYVLGVRVYSPCLRRFLSADAVSPLAEGGIHRYAYCAGDPVNRVDPQGESFFDWLLSGAGLVGALVGLAGVIAAIPTGGASLAGTVALWGAVVLETVSVTAEVGSVVANATGEFELGGVLGWVALGSGLAAGGAGVAGRLLDKGTRAAARLGGDGLYASRGGALSRTKRPSGPQFATPVKGRVTLAMDEMPSSRIGTMENGEKIYMGKWHAMRGEGAAADSVHFGFDVEFDRTLLSPAIAGRAAKGPDSGPLYIYSGVHGYADGQNWSAGRRLYREPRFLSQDRETIGTFRQGAGVRKIVVEDLGRMTPKKAVAAWSRPGEHIHAYCYSAVDELLLQSLNYPPVPVYAPL